MGKNNFKKLSEEELCEKIAQDEKRETKMKVLGFDGVIVGAIGMALFLALGVDVLALIFGLIFLVGGILCFAGIHMQRKTKSMVNEQLSDFYEAELKKTFGPRMDTLKMHFSQSLMRKLRPVDESWDEYQAWRYYEGNYHGTHFSVANVELVDRIRDGDNGDKLITRYEGMVLRCKDICDPALDITLRGNGRSKRESDLADPAVFRQFFSASTADGQPADDLVTPELRELVRKLKACDNHELVDLELRRLRKNISWAQEMDKKLKNTHMMENNVLDQIRKQEDLAQNLPVTALALHDGEAILAVNGYIFAEGMLEGSSLKNVDLIRERFKATLPPVCDLIDILRDFCGK